VRAEMLLKIRLRKFDQHFMCRMTPEDLSV
jgi:hypothetical protein